MENMDILIKNARVLDPQTGEETILSVGIQNKQICFIGKYDAELELEHLIDIKGAYLLPGMIDFHTHLFTEGSTFGVNADLLLSSGVSMAVDMGTAGSAGYEAFRRNDILPRMMPIKSFINLSPVGQPGSGISEPLNRKAIKEEDIERLVKQYPEEILGIKVRISKGIVDKEGITPLDHALELGERLGLPVCVHTTDPPESTPEIVKRLRPGDIYSHMYHNKGMTILDEKGHVFPEFYEARERGVLLEVGNGRMNFSFPVAEQALSQGLYPDIISSDATARTFAGVPDMKDLAFVMSKFWNMGMKLSQIFLSVTGVPARCLQLKNRLDGRIKIGDEADLTVLRAVKQETVFTDSEGNKRTGDRLLVPEMTLVCGRIVYFQGQSEFIF